MDTGWFLAFDVADNTIGGYIEVLAGPQGGGSATIS
jgi:hypothetical protein